MSGDLNLVVAHYRDALGGEFPENAEKLGISNFLAHPFGILDFNSWLLVALGFGFSTLAAGDGLKMDDPYPGYGRIERKRKRILEEYRMGKAELGQELEHIKDYTLERMKEAYDDVKNQRAYFYSLVESRERINHHFTEHLTHLQSSANVLLSAYREANRENRSYQPPRHFSEQWVPRGLRILLRKSRISLLPKTYWKRSLRLL